MGAFSYEEIFKTTDKDELFKEFNALKEADHIYYGLNPYSGSLATLTGLQIVPDPYPDDPWDEDKERRVIDHLYDIAEKWDDALAVKMPDSFIVVALLAE
jgi:hypothetical protein